MKYRTQAVTQGLNGRIRVPGDKSISHRSVMFSALANGVSRITGLLEAEDVLATLAAFQSMGVVVDKPTSGELIIHGVGMHGLKAPNASLDMGNSGTAMRLMAGILSAQSFASCLIGDASLSTRPMQRICKPLMKMGADCQAQENGCPPLYIHPVKPLKSIHYDMPIASAQVKSAILLAGMYADGVTSIIEPAVTRDHTERMLQAYGYQSQSEKLDGSRTEISIQGGGELQASNIDVPADISSAAFFLVAASIVPDSDIILQHVGMNPTRVGVIEILKKMGASIEIIKQTQIAGEDVADIRVKYVGLKGIEISPELVPLAIDEFPILCIAAACAKGVTKIRGAQELRHKESDRIASMTAGLKRMGIGVNEYQDGMDIEGGQMVGATDIETYHDHRIAMSFLIASAVASEPIEVLDCEVIATSFPDFAKLACELGLNIVSC